MLDVKVTLVLSKDFRKNIRDGNTHPLIIFKEFCRHFSFCDVFVLYQLEYLISGNERVKGIINQNNLELEDRIEFEFSRQKESWREL